MAAPDFMVRDARRRAPHHEDLQSNPSPCPLPIGIAQPAFEYPDFTYHNKPEKRAEIERDGFITSGDVGISSHAFGITRRAHR
jgi:hypothetical protein